MAGELMPPQMPPCCLVSFKWKGIEEGFALAAEGDDHTCDTCRKR